MPKIFLIIEREYISRVKKRSFLIMTFLTPLLFVAIAFTPMLLAEVESGEKKQVSVIDYTGLYPQTLTSTDGYEFVYHSEPKSDTVKQDRSVYAMVVISDKLSTGSSSVSIYSEKQIPLPLKNHVKRELEEAARNEKLNESGVENIQNIINESKVYLDIPVVKWGTEGAGEEGSSEMAMVVGYIGMFLIYIFIFVYGTQVMRGVMEEKMSRIVEVMISSVKPFELMMGKIVGIALVGLTQFLMWVILFGGIMTWLGIAFNIGDGGELGGQPSAVSEISSLLAILSNINWGMMLVLFLLYFVGGYLLYASLFAAVGSAVDSETDTQQFVMPITIPIVFAIYVAIYAVQNPDGPMAFWGSIFPFTSPIVMMVRLPYDVAWWEIGLSLFILFSTFVGVTYLSSRIYRVGILMYGKKVSWGELMKWIRRG